MDSADPAIRPFIREGIFVESEFAPESFDLICCFQTLEHVTDPRELVEASKRLLRKDGLLALVTHDYRAPVNRILGRRSPIIDIEHLQIFCRPSLSHLLTSAGLKTVTIESFANVYPLSYWLKLAPIPASLKEAVLGLFKVSGAADVKFRFNVGNLLSVGRKSA
jgi:SAM-dependent methyltransferase